MGLMLGPSLAGILAQRVGLQQSFFLGVGCFVTATLAVVLLMRDLRPDSARPAFKWAAVNPLRSVPPPPQKSLSLILPIISYSHSTRRLIRRRRLGCCCPPRLAAASSSCSPPGRWPSGWSVSPRCTSPTCAHSTESASLLRVSSESVKRILNPPRNSRGSQ